MSSQPLFRDRLGAEEIPSQGELLSWVQSIDYKHNYPQKLKKRDKALFCTLYLTGARVGEIVKRLRKHQVEEQTIDEEKYAMFRNIYTEKNPNHPIRNIAVPLAFEYERKLFDVIKDYMSSLEPDTVLFNITTTRAWQIVSAIIGQFKQPSKVPFKNACHFLRHVRSTHLTELYGFSEYYLYRWHGWTSIAPGGTYIHLKFADIVGLFKKARRGADEITSR